MTPEDIDRIEALWHRLGVLMQMPIPDADEVERQYARCLESVPVMLAALRASVSMATVVTADDAVHVEYGGEG